MDPTETMTPRQRPDLMTDALAWTRDQKRRAARRALWCGMLMGGSVGLALGWILAHAP